MSPRASAIQLDITANLLRWRMFVAVAEEGSLKRAALRLDTNHTALSRQLTSLELLCGTRLFTRTGRGVRLSESGDLILPQVKELLARAEQLEVDIRGKGGSLAGCVTLALMPSLASSVIGRLFTFLREHHPGVRLKILEGASGKVEEWLADGFADLGLLYRYSQPLPAGELPLVTADAYLVGARGDRATATETVPFRMLASVPLVLPSVPNGLRHAIDLEARALGLTLAPLIESDSLTFLKTLAMKEGVNVILSLHAISEELIAGKLQASRIVSPAIQPTISIAHSKAKAPGRAVAVVSELLCSFVTEAGRSWLR